MTTAMSWEFVLYSAGALLACVSPSLQYSYVTKKFEVQLDHFSFTTDDKFEIRYLINDQWYDPTLTTSPIFFYTGNEGKIEWFAENSGFVWELAPEYGALVVFAEHRYYGHSLPFGNLSFTDPKYSGYLSSSQALADYIDLIQYLKTQYVKTDEAPIPVVAFGGSYGGMLAAWIRMKYPGVISGSLAASAPIWQFTEMSPCDSFNKMTTRAFRVSGSDECVDVIAKSWAAIDKLGATDDGLQWLSETFHTCEPINNSRVLKDSLSRRYGSIAMANYPYPSNFLGSLPGNPVKVLCEGMRLEGSDPTPKELLEAVFRGLNDSLNYTGSTMCLNLTSDGLPSSGPGWDYQSCTEMVIPHCDHGDTMFEKSSWNIDNIADECYKQFKVRPSVDYVKNLYGAKELAFASNIIFSNGFLDPWSAGGVLKSVSKLTVTTGNLAGAAHHLDLRASNELDPPSVKEVRQMYRKTIRRWVQEIL